MEAAPIQIKWHTGLPIYASEAFLGADGDRYGWIGGLDKSGLTACVLPYTVTRKAAFRLVRFRTATIPILRDLDAADEVSFLDGAVQYLRSTGADIVIPSGNTAIFRVYPRGAAAAPYGTYVVDLRLPEDVLLRQIRKTYRHNIRKAENAGVEIACGQEYLESCYELISATLRRSGSTFRSYKEFHRRSET